LVRPAATAGGISNDGGHVGRPLDVDTTARVCPGQDVDGIFGRAIRSIGLSADWRDETTRDGGVQYRKARKA
jgi:hypothetical protein